MGPDLVKDHPPDKPDAANAHNVKTHPPDKQDDGGASECSGWDLAAQVLGKDKTCMQDLNSAFWTLDLWSIMLHLKMRVSTAPTEDMVRTMMHMTYAEHVLKGLIFQAWHKVGKSKQSVNKQSQVADSSIARAIAS